MSRFFVTFREPNVFEDWFAQFYYQSQQVVVLARKK